jgi:hypothetical protein
MPAVVVQDEVQQRDRWPTNWVLYRFTAEALKHKKHLFPSGVGSSASADRLRALAEQIRGALPGARPVAPGPEQARAGRGVPGRSRRAGSARGDRWGQAAVSVRGAAAVRVARAAAKSARRLGRRGCRP